MDTLRKEENARCSQPSSLPTQRRSRCGRVPRRSWDASRSQRGAECWTEDPGTQRPHSQLYVGKGQVDRAQCLLEREGANLMISDDALSPCRTRKSVARSGSGHRPHPLHSSTSSPAGGADDGGQVQVRCSQSLLLPRLVGHGSIWSGLGGRHRSGARARAARSEQPHDPPSHEKIHGESGACAYTAEPSTRPAQGGRGAPWSPRGYTKAGKATLLNHRRDRSTPPPDRSFVTRDSGGPVVSRAPSAPSS